MGYGVLNFRHPEFDKAGIDPSQSQIIDHSWSKWRAIWKDIQSGYKKSDANFRQSGTHDRLFEGYILGRIDVLYLHLHMQIKPQLHEAVTESLRKGVFQDSGDIIVNDDFTPSNKKRSLRSSPTTSVAGAISQFSDRDNNIQEQRMKLMVEEVEITKRNETIVLEKLDLQKQQIELEKEKFVFAKQKSIGEMKKSETENQKLMTDQYISLTQHK